MFISSLSQEESYHTQLASCYLQDLLALKEEKAPEREIKRAKYVGLLETTLAYYVLLYITGF